MTLQPVILCGGSGTRMWPLSRQQHPKQLLNLVGQDTLLQATVKRLDGVSSVIQQQVNHPLLIANEEYRFLIAEQLREVGVTPAAILLEPVGRNTAPALTLAALLASQQAEDPIMVVMPADHFIQDQAAFHAAIPEALALAELGKLVTFGICPTAPETGYGYIRVGTAIGETAKQVARFVEKPNLETAQHYLASGDYLWNGGIFVIKASVWLAKIAAHRPDIAQSCVQAFAQRRDDMDFTRPDKAAFAACPSDSIDYAVMEPLTAEGANQGEVVVVPLDAKWSDVGAWNALWEIGPKDANGNVCKGDVLAVETHDSLVFSHGRLVATVGLKEAVVVETPDAILVADRQKIHHIQDIVKQLKAANRSEIDANRKVYRPWGWYDRIDSGKRFQVKHIVVYPGCVLSLQMHHHRTEHWIVVSGTAKVTKGEHTYLVAENESTYIPLGVIHRLENPGLLPLEMIEVQSGSYLGEDDIVRFEDRYGRQD